MPLTLTPPSAELWNPDEHPAPGSATDSGGFMGTKQHGPGQQGSQQTDNRPNADRDPKRNKQSDRGQHAQTGKRDAQQQASEVQQSQLGGHRDFEHRQENEGRTQTRQQQDVRRQQEQSGAGASQGERQSQQNVYGEGNYAASRQYNEATKEYAESGRAEADARAATPRSEAKAREMADAEAEGKRHAKGEDPALNRRAKSSGSQQQDEE
jgi:hypothetical protein